MRILRALTLDPSLSHDVFSDALYGISPLHEFVHVGRTQPNYSPQSHVVQCSGQFNITGEHIYHLDKGFAI
jgi:hypothetical protein